MNCHEPKKFFAFSAISDKQNPFYKIGMLEFFIRHNYDFLNLKLINELINELKTNKESQKALEINKKLQNEATNFLEKSMKLLSKKFYQKEVVL